jgi:putative ubiquitin-RnfH superfamily antitoxin RatB of RatAB toxin-antitoxin module
VKRIVVTVVYALEDRATEIRLALPAGSSVADALARSGLAGRHPEIDLATVAIGVYGTRVRPDTLLADGDRVEIYRPLLIDPKERRRRRAVRRSHD